MAEDSLCNHCNHRGYVLGKDIYILELGDSEVKEFNHRWCKKGARELTNDPNCEIVTKCSEFEEEIAR